MLCFDLQNRLCPDWERGVWHPGAGWCAVAGASCLPLKRSVIHQGLGWRGGWRGDSGGRVVLWVGTMDGVKDVAWWTARKNAGRCDGSCSALHWASQRAPQADAACCVFCPCPVAWPEERIASRFSSLLKNENCAMESTAQHFLLLALWPCVFPLVGVSGVSLRSLAGGRCFSPGRRHPFRRGIRWRGDNPASARSGACCSSRCGQWSRARGCLHPHRSG